MFTDKTSLENALKMLYGTAGHLLKIWFALKHMGLGKNENGVEIDTTNSTPSLKRLFSCGADDGRFYIPFAHTPRYLTMKYDASRSIIQTTIQRWASSGSVVTCDPTDFIDIEQAADSKLIVKTSRRYPFGLGIGESGFALEDGKRVCIPIKAFSIWYGRKTEIPKDQEPLGYLVSEMLRDLNISTIERNLIFIEDEFQVTLQNNKLTDLEIFDVCKKYIDGLETASVALYKETFQQYERKIKSMVSDLDQPKWMRNSPTEELNELIKAGAKAILLLGEPRTGKTRMIDQIIARDSIDRCTIQIHDGWGYDNLVEGLKPDADGNWNWQSGPLKEAIESGKKYIVLEEINRTVISQALGEVFSLIEDTYRGEENSILLRSGKRFFIPSNLIFLMTMNTLDKSTEEVDDALMGRVASVEVPPRSEDLFEMLTNNALPMQLKEKILELFSEIQNIYPLGHGYFAGLVGDLLPNDIIRHYKARVRPVLSNYLGRLKSAELEKIDNMVDELFGKV